MLTPCKTDDEDYEDHDDSLRYKLLICVRINDDGHDFDNEYADSSGE